MISFTIGWFDLLAVQELSPAPQFKSIDSLLLSLLYGPTLTFLHDLYGPILTSECNYWKNNSFDYMDFVGKLLSLFEYAVCHSFPSKEQASFNFVAAVIV